MQLPVPHMFASLLSRRYTLGSDSTLRSNWSHGMMPLSFHLIFAMMAKDGGSFDVWIRHSLKLDGALNIGVSQTPNLLFSFNCVNTKRFVMNSMEFRSLVHMCIKCAKCLPNKCLVLLLKNSINIFYLLVGIISRSIPNQLLSLMFSLRLKLAIGFFRLMASVIKSKCILKILCILPHSFLS
jgi:hypothetical protein